MAAVCEVNECGVQAAGRCATCRRAFCMSHQAPGPATIAITDLCRSCDDERWRTNPQRIYKQRLSEAGHFVHYEAAPQLRAAGAPSYPLYTLAFRQALRRKLFRTVSIEEPYQEKVGDLWLLGKSEWEYNDGGNYGGTDIIGLRLTALCSAFDSSRAEVRAVTWDAQSKQFVLYRPEVCRFKGSAIDIADEVRRLLTGAGAQRP